MHDKPQVGLVETHAEGAGRYQCLELVSGKRIFGLAPFIMFRLSRIGRHQMPAVPQEPSRLVRGRDGQRVDDARAWQLAEVLVQPGQPLLRAGQVDHGQVQAATVQRAAQHQRLLVGARAELVGDVPGDPRVRGRGRGQDRHAGRQLVQQGAQPPVVRPEVVAPVGDAVRLVHHQHPGRRGQLGQHLVAEAGVVQPFRADQQHVHLPVCYLGVDLLPLLDVGRVHRARLDAGPAGRADLVAHEGEQRGDDHRRPGASGPQQRGRGEVDGRLAPPRPLHHQRPAVLLDQGPDRRPLVLAQPRVLASQRAQAGLGLVAERARLLGHPSFVPAGEG